MAQQAASAEAELQEIDAHDRARLDDIQGELDKADHKATRHYTLHKEAAREAALRYAADTGCRLTVLMLYRRELLSLEMTPNCLRVMS